MITDFHAYEFGLGRDGLLPLLERRGFPLAGKSVLDVGCGYGGVLSAIAASHPLRRALGVDLDDSMVREGKAKSPGVVLETRDFFGLGEETFDLILMRDVLEHMPDTAGALRKAAELLAPGGRIFASFAPFRSPFGGHQHNGAGPFARAPWIHLFPEAWFRRLLRLEGNAYKEAAALEDDMESVLRTRLTLAGFRRMVPAAGLGITYLAGYLSRPDYRLKFGLPAVRFPAAPVLGEFLCTGVEALLARA